MLRFTKMHGLGNDFILLCTQEPIQEEFNSLALQMCAPHTGIGADGLVYLFPSQVADIAMRIFNADGTLAEQCGNAIRCVAKYYFERVSPHKTELTIESKIGVQSVQLFVEADEVKTVQVDMGAPILHPHLIPVRLVGEQVIQQEIHVNGKTFLFTAVSMGNPHAVIEVEEASHDQIDTWGPLLERHELFPHKANIEFITIHGPEEISLRVWERGVGETLACGSGACAALVAGVLMGKTDRCALVHLKGGDLYIAWNEEDNHVYMTGPAAFVFEGRWLQG
jgi:diaminopimelate epimerase